MKQIPFTAIKECRINYKMKKLKMEKEKEWLSVDYQVFNRK